MQIPHDLVTVIRGPRPGCFWHRPLKRCFGKAAAGADLSAGNLPAVGTGAHRSGPRGIGRAEKPMDHGSFLCCHSASRKAFCLRKTPFQRLVRGYANCSVRTKRKGIYHEKTQHPQGCCRPDCPGSVRRCAQRLRRRRIQHRFQRSKFFCRCQQRSIRRRRRRGCRKERGRPDRCHLCPGAQRQHRRAVCCCQGCLGRLDRRSEGAGGRRKC